MTVEEALEVQRRELAKGGISTTVYRLLNCLLLLLVMSCSKSNEPSPQPQIRFFGVRPAVAPNGKTIVFGSLHSGNSDLYLMDLETSHITKISNTLEREAWPYYAPDGETVIYAVENSDRPGSKICSMNVKTSQARVLTSGDSYDCMPSYSSDGRRIVFARAHQYRPYSMGGYTWDEWDVCVMDPDGSNVQRITTEQFRSISPPYFSNDGSKVLFAGGSTDHAIHIVDLDRNNKLETVLSGSYDTDPVFTPDGRGIFFVSRRVSRKDIFDYELWRMNTSDESLLQLTRIQCYSTSPVFIDADRVLFLSDCARKDRYALQELNLKTGNRRTLLNDVYEDVQE